MVFETTWRLLLASGNGQSSIVEVLFEFKESRKPLSIPRDALLQRVERELALCVGDACLLPPGMSLCDDVASSLKKLFFLLQWNALIDVASVEDADKITVVRAFAPACEKCCDGDSLLVPLIHPGSDTSMFTKLSRILSHGYMQCGFLPKLLFLFLLLCCLELR